jgi:Tol biopolymer transport system component
MSQHTARHCEDGTLTHSSKLRSAMLQALIPLTVTATIGAREVNSDAVDVSKPPDRRLDSTISGTPIQGLRSIPVGPQTPPKSTKRSTRKAAASAPNPASRLRGQIIFHRYTNYDAWDGRLYLYDFTTKRLRFLSERWQIDHAINANFSPDGKQIVFMGVPRGQHRGDAWNVYLWTINSRNQPVNLTDQPGTRDEDPRFAPDGKRIVFKQDGELRIMDLRSRQIQAIRFGGVKAERSMPMFTSDGERVVYAEGARKDMDLFLVDVADGTRRPLAIEPEIQEYFPVPLDASRFLYARWTSEADHHDQVWSGSLDGKSRGPLPFNEPGSDSSDPYPVDDRLIVFSSTRAGGQGGYDLYLGDQKDGSSWTLSSLGINSGQEELGACYDRRPVKKQVEPTE